ncbi:type IV pilus assembly protein PilM [Candidatus Kaiserbacteria bacterium]|nr:MAG: type IV pilus assembly protein PilM [Candidatus Kaiserbacteria bacterium]
MAFDLSTLTSLLKTDTAKAATRSGVLGIDIGTSSIKVVQIKDVKGLPTLETYGELQLGPYEGIDLGRGTHLPAPKIVEALVDILREAGTTAKDVVYALSYNASFTTTIQVPTVEQEKLDAMVPVEARKYIPVSLTKVELNWFPVGVHPEERVTNVLVSAIYNEAQERYMSIMAGCGLKVIAREIEIFSMIRAVLTPTDDVVAIIDFGATSSRLCIVKQGVLVKTHSLLLSGVEITSILAKTLAIEFKEAEDLKRAVGLRGMEDDVRIQKTIISALERDLREIYMVIKRYEDEDKVAVQKIVLCGSGAQLTGIQTYVQDMFSRPTILANPFAKVSYPAFLEDTLRHAGPTFAGALGVALRVFQNE